MIIKQKFLKVYPSADHPPAVALLIWSRIWCIGRPKKKPLLIYSKSFYLWLNRLNQTLTFINSSWILLPTTLSWSGFTVRVILSFLPAITSMDGEPARSFCCNSCWLIWTLFLSHTILRKGYDLQWEAQ